MPAMPPAERGETPDTFYTPRKVRLLLKLLPYHDATAPRLRWFEDLMVQAPGYRNADEWWWQVRGDLLWALERIGLTHRTLVELCVLSLPPVTQFEAGERTGISQGSVSKGLTRAYEDMAFVLGWRQAGESDKADLLA